MLKDLKIHTDVRGNLIAFEKGNNLDFELKRTYILSKNTKALPRGFHSHKNLNQLIVCLAGSCEILLQGRDQVKDQQKYTLQENQSCRIYPNTWREIHAMSPNCILMVLCDKEYDPNDYCYEKY